MKGFTLRNFTTLAGIGLISLAIIDVAIQWRSSGFGTGVSARVAGESLGAFLMIGLIVGMLTGIGMSFAYFMWREKKLESQPDDLSQLLEELSREEPLFLDDSKSMGDSSADDKSETLEPWERPTDWWKSDEE